MKLRGIPFWVLLVISGILEASCPLQAAEPADVRVIRAENKLLQAARERLRAENKLLSAEVARLRKENSALKARLEELIATAKTNAPGAATRPISPDAVPKQPRAKLQRAKPTQQGVFLLYGRPVMNENIRVELVAIGIMKVLVEDRIRGQSNFSKEKLLWLRIRVVNTSDRKKFDYQTWGAETMKLFESLGGLADDLGNNYKAIHWGISQAPVGRTEKASIYPGKSIDDSLIFEVPVPKAKQLILSLPTDNVGGKGIIKFIIPVENIGGDK